MIKTAKKTIKQKSFDMRKASYVPEVMVDGSRLVIAMQIFSKEGLAFLQGLMASFQKKRRTLSPEEKFLLPRKDCPEENKIPMTSVFKIICSGVSKMKKKDLIWKRPYNKRKASSILAELDEFIEKDKKFRNHVQSLAKIYFS